MIVLFEIKIVTDLRSLNTKIKKMYFKPKMAAVTSSGHFPEKMLNPSLKIA